VTGVLETAVAEDPIALERYNNHSKERQRRWRQEQIKDEVSRERYLDRRIKSNQALLARYKEYSVVIERFKALDREKWK
jgi:flagellar motility protein MotE (MotC chaperone)